MTHAAAARDALARSHTDVVTPLRVVIADDSREVRRALTEMVSDLPRVEVLAAAENATMAYRYARDLRPDVLILDINMPDRSGVWVMRMLQQDEIDTRVLVFTNHGSDFYRRKCLEAGATAFFDKHVEMKALASTLGRLADMRLDTQGPAEQQTGES